MLSYYAGNRPRSKTMPMFVQFARWRDQSDIRQRDVWSSSPDGGTGCEVAVYDCRLVTNCIVLSLRVLVTLK